MLKKYDYKLQNILDFKSSMEDQMISKYNNEKKILEKENNILDKYIETKIKIENQKDELSFSGTIRDLKNYNTYIEETKYKINKQKEVINNSQKKVELAKENLINACKDKKIFEKLKENDYKKHEDEEKKKEAITVDEIVTFISCNN